MEILATLFFAVVKLGAYFGFLRLCAPRRSGLIVLRNAFVRLVLGVVVGALLYAGFVEGRNVLEVYLTAILLGRLVLWWAVCMWFYRPMPSLTALKLSVGGTLVSYLIDVPVALGVLSIIGGIC